MDGGCYGIPSKDYQKCLKAALKDYIVTEETFHNYLVEIESIINSRPLTPITNNPDDIESSTPNHFLVGRASPNQRFIVTTEKDATLGAQWKATQAMTNIFWKKWIKEYLPSLTKRQKWTSHLPNVKVGDLVIIAEYKSERSKWSLARVVETFPGKDQVVRSTKGKTAINELVRPVAKLSLLEEGS